MVLSGEPIYGTTESGGAAGTGTIFKMNSDGSGFTQIHNFAANSWNSALGNMTNSEGAYPVAAMNLAGDTLYGTASQGGATGGGTVFKLNTNGSGFTVLHGFTNNIDGSSPSGELLFAGGVLYGTTFTGSPAGGGTVFKVNIDGSGFSTLHQFAVASYDPASGNYLNSDGAAPAAGLTLCGATLYGTASKGGSGGGGTIFSIGTNGTGFANLCVFTALVSGTNLDGANPQAGMVLCGDTLYGTAYDGGSNGDGALFTFSLLTAAAPVLFTAGPTNGSGAGDGGICRTWNRRSWRAADQLELEFRRRLRQRAAKSGLHVCHGRGIRAEPGGDNNQGGMVVGFGPQIAVALPTAEFTANPATGGRP